MEEPEEFAEYQGREDTAKTSVISCYLLYRERVITAAMGFLTR